MPPAASARPLPPKTLPTPACVVRRGRVHGRVVEGAAGDDDALQMPMAAAALAAADRASTCLPLPAAWIGGGSMLEYFRRRNGANPRLLRLLSA